MNLQMINLQSKCCRLLGEIKITEKVTKQCEVSMLLKNLELIKNQNVFEYVKQLPEDIQVLAFQDEKRLCYILEILKSDVTVSKITSVIKFMPLSELMKFTPQEVCSALSLGHGNEEYIGIYLLYYKNDRLTEEEMKNLWKGLKWFRERRTCLTDEWLGCIGEKRSIFMEPVITNNFICCIKDYDECLKILAERMDVVQFLNKLHANDAGNSVVDENNLAEICENTQQLTELWDWLCTFFDENQRMAFLPLWLQNHALIYDLEFLKKKAQKERRIDINSFLMSRTAYIAFLYDEELTGKFDEQHEELMIYAITRKKKAFLNLVRENMELYQSISCRSILFQRVFFEKCINLNTMNKKNLEACDRMKCTEDIAWTLLAGREHTFGEMELIYFLPESYVRLYESFSARRTDERIRIMREIVKNMCLPDDVRQEELSEKLMEKPLSQWMQQEFGHIEGLSRQNAIRLLSEYRLFARFISDMTNDAEVRYVWTDIGKCQKFSSMEEIRKHSLEENQEWRYLAETFDFSDEFIKENQERIRKFIFEDGAHIMKTYCESQKMQQDALRRLISAELMGRFKELKYYHDDLLKEIDFPIADWQKKIWMANNREERGAFAVWEEDGLLPVMQIGVKPCKTCLSYEDGMYKQCLLACHDANKKVLYLSYNGKVVLRAAIRLTKGMYGRYTDKKEPQLQFADLMVSEKKNRTDERKYAQEFLTLFLERSYTSGLPERLEKRAYDLILDLVRKKQSR